ILGCSLGLAEETRANRITVQRIEADITAGTHRPDHCQRHRHLGQGERCAAGCFSGNFHAGLNSSCSAFASLQSRDSAVAKFATKWTASTRLSGHFLPFVDPADRLMMKLAGILQIQLRLNPRAIRVHCADAKVKTITDFTRAPAASDQLENFKLPVG